MYMISIVRPVMIPSTKSIYVIVDYIYPLCCKIKPIGLVGVVNIKLCIIVMTFVM